MTSKSSYAYNALKNMHQENRIPIKVITIDPQHVLSFYEKIEHITYDSLEYNTNPKNNEQASLFSSQKLSVFIQKTTTDETLLQWKSKKNIVSVSKTIQTLSPNKQIGNDFFLYYIPPLLKNSKTDSDLCAVLLFMKKTADQKLKSTKGIEYRPIGMINTTINQEDSSANINLLFIDIEYRHFGVAALLVNRMKDILDSKKIMQCTLWAIPLEAHDKKIELPRLVSFYNSAGFIQNNPLSATDIDAQMTCDLSSERRYGRRYQLMQQKALQQNSPTWKLTPQTD